MDLASRSPSTMRFGLERMEAALAALEHPERRYPILQVAGTNGKGSTCAFASECLRAHGLKVGRYTSPHLWRMNERFWISGEEASDAALGARTLEVLERLGPLGDPLTYFELGTVVALWLFSQERVDAAVLEVGLGGRLDATTATTPEVTAVSSISFDHTELLGSTLSEIAGEKAGTFKPGVPAVVSAQRSEAEAALEARAREVGAPLLREGRDFALTPDAGGLAFSGVRWRFRVPSLSLRGAHQVQNAALALESVEQLAAGRWEMAPETLARAMGKTRWPGRLEEVRGSPPVVLDGAHNPAGVEALLQALDALYPGVPVHLVFGVLADKDTASMGRLLFPRCASIHLTPLPSPRSAPAAASEADARRLCPQVFVHDAPQPALEAAARRAGGQGLVLCAGSLVLVGVARHWAEG